MEEKLNQMLFDTLNSGIEKLKTDKTQCTEYLENYSKDKESNEFKEGKNELDKVNKELEEKESDLAQYNVAKEAIEKIKESEKTINSDFEKLLKEKEDYQAQIDEINSLRGGESDTRNNLEKAISEIDVYLSRYNEVRQNNKVELEKHNKIIDGLLNKYNIKEKFEKEQENEQQKENKQRNESTETEVKKAHKEIEEPVIFESVDTKDPRIVEPKEEAKDSRIIEPKEEVKDSRIIEPKKEVRDPRIIRPREKVGEPKITAPISLKTVNNVICSIKNGKLTYTISGLDIHGKDFVIEKAVEPKRITGREKRNIKRFIDKTAIKDVDINLYRILKNNKNLIGIDSDVNYLKQVERALDGENKDEEDINLTYNLTDIRKADISGFKKWQLKRFARNSEKNGIADYIKPQGRIKALLGKAKQRLLTSGSQEEEREELDSREDYVYNTYKDMRNEEGFDFDRFCEDMDLSEEERKELEAYEKVNSSKKSFYKGIENKTSNVINPINKGQNTVVEKGKEENQNSNDDMVK